MKAILADLRARLRQCEGVLVDSNVLLDIAISDPNWALWSEGALAACGEHVPLVINQIIYAEVSVNYDSVEAVNTAFPASYYHRQPLPWDAGFLAGKCFVDYRRRGGTRTSPMPDFYIGAHAAIARLAILTRDPRRYRNYFPSVKIVAP
jgi:predicted nucleic acid-binding protein